MAFYGFRELEKLMRTRSAPALIKLSLVDGSGECTITDSLGRDFTASGERIQSAIADAVRQWREGISDLKVRDGFELRAIRESLGMSQYEFAQALGSSYASVRRWERGVFRIPKTRQVLLGKLIAERFGNQGLR